MRNSILEFELPISAAWFRQATNLNRIQQMTDHMLITQYFRTHTEVKHVGEKLNFI